MNKRRLPPPLTWAPPRAARDVSAATQLRRCGRLLLRQIRGNLRGTLADRDPEYLHQLRVAVRRLRVLLRLLRGAAPDGARRHGADALKRLARLLGPARDGDVFRQEIWPPLRLRIDDARLAPALDAAWLVQRHRAMGRARQALAAPRFHKLLCELDVLFAEPRARGDGDDAVSDAGFLHAAIRRRARHVRAAYAAAKDEADYERRLHALRIAVKKLRYALEFLAPLLKRHRAARALKRLARLQAVLGEMNDIAAAQARIDTALQRRRGVAAERARETLRQWRAARIRSLRRKFNAAWKAYRQVKPVA